MEINGLSISYQQPIYKGETVTSDAPKAQANYQQTRLDVVDEVVLTGLGYDSMPKPSKGAIDTYAMVDGFEQRDALADIFGVDLYA